VAFQQISMTATCNGSPQSYCRSTLVPGVAGSETASAIMTGWTVGGGIDSLLSGNWLGRLEFRYADFGHFNHNFFAGTPADEVVVALHAQTYTVIGGIAYKFNGGSSIAR
jgi:outer membrane immunogenic protein